MCTSFYDACPQRNFEAKSLLFIVSIKWHENMLWSGFEQTP
jgi:hypothetical protein